MTKKNVSIFCITFFNFIADDIQIVLQILFYTLEIFDSSFFVSWSFWISQQSSQKVSLSRSSSVDPLAGSFMNAISVIKQCNLWSIAIFKDSKIFLNNIPHTKRHNTIVKHVPFVKVLFYSTRKLLKKRNGAVSSLRDILRLSINTQHSKIAQLRND